MNEKLDRKKVYNDLVKFYSKLFPQKQQPSIQAEVGDVWRRLRAHKSDDEFMRAVDEQKMQWREVASRNKVV